MSMMHEQAVDLIIERVSNREVDEQFEVGNCIKILFFLSATQSQLEVIWSTCQVPS